MDSRYNFEVEWPGFVGKFVIVSAFVGEWEQSSGIKEDAWVSSLSNCWYHLLNMKACGWGDGSYPLG